MNCRKLFMGVVVTCTICLLTVLGSTEKAEAWGWTGFSSLCLEDSVRGPEGSTIMVTLSDVTVHTQCGNINSDQFDQPGTGNAGGLTLSIDPVASPDKNMITFLSAFEPVAQWLIMFFGLFLLLPSIVA